MTRTASFWAELAHPTGKRILVETRSYRDLVSQIRFFAATENARLVRRGEIPERSGTCTRCHDLFVWESETDRGLCDECVGQLLDGEEIP